jgi:hypothetical protein
MEMKSAWNRRGFLGTGMAAESSLFTPRRAFAKSGAPAASTAVTGLGQSGNPYGEIVAQQLSHILREPSA